MVSESNDTDNKEGTIVDIGDKDIANGSQTEDLTSSNYGAHLLSSSAQNTPITLFEPIEGWGDWEKGMYLQGRVHQTLEALSNHCIVFQLQPGDIEVGPSPESTAVPQQLEGVPPQVGGAAPTFPQVPAGAGEAPGPEQAPATQPDIKSLEYCQMIADRVDLLGALRIAHKHRNAHGKAIIYPIREKIPDPSSPLGYKLGECQKLRVLDPTNIRVIRDTFEDLRDFYYWFPKMPAKLEAMGKPTPRPDYTGRIVGFIFTMGPAMTQKLTDPITGEVIGPDKFMKMDQEEPEVSYAFGKVFYTDDELIVLFRETSMMYPDGLSLLRANYTQLENKFTIDKLAVMAYWKSVLPTWVIRAPMSMNSMEIRSELSVARANPGSDVILKGDKSELDIERTVADGITNFAFLLDYAEKQYEASMGVFDTMFHSVGANRATAFIQSDFFEKAMQPDRLEIERTMNQRFFEPLLRYHYGLDKRPPAEDTVVDQQQYALPQWDWKSLIGDDMLDVAAALNPYQNNMAQNQVEYVLETIMGLPTAEGETIGSQAIAAGKNALGQVRVQIPGLPEVATAPQPPQPIKQMRLDDDLGLTLDERRRKKGLKKLKKGGELVPIPDNYTLFDPSLEI